MAYTLAWRNQPPLSVEDWRRRARRRLPELAWSYLDGGADDLVTLTENVSAFRRWRLRQRCLTGVSAPETAVVIAQTPVSIPVALAPTGGCGISHWSGDIAVARAAERNGTRLILSTASNYTLEEVSAATEHQHWFQLYPFGNRERVDALLQRARKAGYTGLFVTVDVPVLGNREGERATGMGSPWTLRPGGVVSMLAHPRWLYGVLRHKRIAPIHYREPGSGARVPSSGQEILHRGVMAVADEAVRAAQAQARYMQADLCWDDVAWMRDRWKGPFYVKGLLDPDDAEYAVDRIGVDGIVVSNHGGRQLDRTLATIDALPAIAERVGNRAEVYLDGGIRRGTDVITALCLGARGVFIGRPYLYGLAAAGEQGVAAVLEILRTEITRALVLMGCANVAALDRSWLQPSVNPTL